MLNCLKKMFEKIVFKKLLNFFFEKMYGKNVNSTGGEKLIKIEKNVYSVGVRNL
jgi:hypothetical protein